MTSVLSGHLHRNPRRETFSPTLRKRLIKPWFSTDPGPAGEMTFMTTGISVAVTHATSGRQWETVTWRGRKPTLGLGHSELSGGLWAAPRGTPEHRPRWRKPARRRKCHVSRLRLRGSGWQTLPVGASVLSQVGCRLPTQRSWPHRLDSLSSAPRPGRGRRWAGENAAPGLGLAVLPFLLPTFSPKSFIPFPPLPVVFHLFARRCRRPRPTPIPPSSCPSRGYRPPAAP